MKCPVCGHKVRPSKKVPGKYLCDTCRKRFPASAVVPDFFDDPLNGPETYHSTAEAMRSMRKKQTEDSSSEVTKATSQTDTADSSDSALTMPQEADISEPVSQTDTKPADASSSEDSANALVSDGSASKKKTHLPLILFALILIAAIAVFLFFYRQPSNIDNNAPASTSKKEANTDGIYQQGETASYNGVDITLDSYVESEGDDWSVPAEGNEFMFVHMTITNHSNNDLVISSMASFENYCDDTKLDYSAAAFTALATTSDQPKLDGTIAPNETLEGYLSLEVPLNWSTVEIQYTDKVWSEDAIHFQIKQQK